MVQLSTIINGNEVITVTSKGRLTDNEVAQCICNASVGALSTRQLLDHFRLFQAERPHQAFQTWAVEHGLWKTWLTKSGKIKPVGCNERKAELIKSGDCAELRVLRQYDAIRVMFAADKETAERLLKMEQADNEPQEKTPSPKEPKKPQALSNPLLPALAHYETVTASAAGRLNRLMAQCSVDESLAWIALELRSIVKELLPDNDD